MYEYAVQYCTVREYIDDTITKACQAPAGSLGDGQLAGPYKRTSPSPQKHKEWTTSIVLRMFIDYLIAGSLYLQSYRHDANHLSCL